MAIYHAHVQVIGRSSGRSVVAAAAYRAAECLHDDKLDRDHDYTAKTGVVHSEIMLPDGAPERWAQGPTRESRHAARTRLWNEVEAGEKRKDAQLARELEFALPRELSRAEAVALACDFVREQFVDRGMVADLNVHWDTGADGEAKPHAHVLLTMRQVTPEGFGPKVRAWNDAALYEGVRERWASLTNERLAAVGHDVRIDHRSYAEQGITLEPQNKIGPAGMRRAERGEVAERADEHVEIARRNGEAIIADPNLILDALTRQHATFTRRDLARFVSRHTADADQFALAMARAEATPELVRLGVDGRGQDRFTTREMLAVERRMEAAAGELSSYAMHIVGPDRRHAALAAAARMGVVLGGEQILAVEHVTRGQELALVVGYAGTGKSTMLGVAQAAWKAAGYQVRGAALSGIAAEGLEGGSGIASRTLASLEWAWKEGRDLLTSRDVLVVDEAGMIGSRQMERVLSAAQAAGAKVVLVGDPEQLQAIEAGAAFRALAERHGAVEVSAVRRQRAEWQREATRELATARTGAALGRYAAAGMVVGADTRQSAKAALVAGWDRVRHQSPQASQVILAYTRADVAELNALARERMRASGALRGADQVVATEFGERSFAAGDRLMFRRNERGLGAGPDGRGGVAVKNGTLGTVLAVEVAGERLTVRLDGPSGPRGSGGIGQAGKDAPPVVTFYAADYGHIEHGYATTIHKAQGVTVDRVHVLASRHMDRHAAYVALTRHRDGVALHYGQDEFGDAAALARTLSREGLKDTSLDYDAPGLEAGPGSAPEPEPAWRAWGPTPGGAEAVDPAERAASAYAVRRGVAPAAETAVGPGTPGQRAAARTAVLLNRIGALQQAGMATAQAHGDQVAERQAAGLGAPDLEPWFRRGRALRTLDEALAAAARAVARGSAALGRVAEAMAALPDLMRAAAERARAAAQEAEREAAAQRQAQEAAATGVVGWRERYAAEKRQRAAAAARDAQARGLAERWSGLAAAYTEALPGLDRDPRHAAARAALEGFARELRGHPEAVEALRTRPEAFGMAERPTLAWVLTARSPERAVAAQLDGWEAERRTERAAQEARQAAERAAAQEAARRAEAARPRQSYGPSM